MKLNLVFLITFAFSVSVSGIDTIEKWDFFEISLDGPSNGNPYKEIQLSATFSNGDKTVDINGFYHGEGIYKIRFMPGTVGKWEYITSSNNKKLHNKKGKFTCTKNTGNNHGPVQVTNQYHFSYADGHPYKPFGATCYGWFHYGKEYHETIWNTLSKGPFNKARIMILGFGGAENKICPEINVFQPDTSGGVDLERFNPVYWDYIEKCLMQLGELGVEADIIIYNGCPGSIEDFYLQYLVSRLSAFRNVWWSMANEYNLDRSKTQEDWDRRGNLLAELDPYDHLLSIHNHPAKEFAWDKDYITHVSCQYADQIFVASLLDKYQKPVINDEAQYEGDHFCHWGNISAKELVHRFWLGAVNGVYTTHGETYSDGKGFEYIGESPERIAFLREILEESPAEGINNYRPGEFWQNLAAGDINKYLLLYFGVHQPGIWYFDFPEDGSEYTVELIDPWEMTIESLGTYSGKINVKLPRKPRQALRAVRINKE